MLTKRIEEIIKNERDIIPLLRKLSQSEKKELVPFLKKFKDTVFHSYTIEKKSKYGISYTSEHSHTELQRDLIQKACFVCFNKTDFKRAFWDASNVSVKEDYLKNIIPWYTPKWYGDLINEEMPWGLTYIKMMELSKLGLIEPSHELILSKLPDAIVDRKHVNKEHKSYYTPEVLLQNKETLNEHIWLLFEEESSLNNYYNYLHLDNYQSGNGIWIDTIINLTQKNKLNRKKILIATIYSSTKGFNKTLSGWFFDLLIKLNPTQEEVLALQNELFSALNCPHSKVVNTVLKYFKLVANQKKFKHKVFIENASILLNSETKSVVSSTLMILDKIVKTHKTSTTSVCKKAAEALINIDEKIQLRAAKIIEKYGDEKNQELIEDINLYSDNLFHGTKEALKDYINSDEVFDDYEDEAIPINFLAVENILPKYETLDELIFFVSQVIDNNETYHIDLLLSYLPKLNVLLDQNNVSKLEPIFKRALDLSMNFEWSSQIGILESEAAFYINDFAEILMKKYPKELKSFRKTKDQKIEKLKQARFYNSHIKDNLKEIERQSIPDYIYQIHHLLFIKSKALIKKGLTLDLLSTPTHAPCWIDPQTFIDRVTSYEKHDEQIDLYDLQIALGRLPADEFHSDISSSTKGISSGEIKNILRYYYGGLELEKANMDKPELWLQSVISKGVPSEIRYFQEYLSNPLQKELSVYSWKCELSDHFYKQYDYTTGKHVEKKMVRKQLKFEDFNPQKKEPDSLISSITGIFSKTKKSVKLSSIYENMFFKKQQYYITIRPNDEIKFLFLSPNNPSAFLSHVVHNNLKESTFFDETSKKNMVNLLKGLYQIWYRSDYSETTYLFLATGFLCSEKVARELAAEIWIKANSKGNMNNSVLGEMLGRLQSGEYAPLKRFTDLLTTNLFNISNNHNKHLFTLLDTKIGHMNKTPIRGLKKLLEVFLEVRHNCPEMKMSQSTKEILVEWGKTASLKSINSKLL